jgi:hypothetical protein
LNRLMSVLLIPLLVFGSLLPHAHACGDAPDDHSLRPHFHFSIGHHSHDDHHPPHSHGRHRHGHHHADLDDCDRDDWADGHLAGQAPASHDSDAVYLNGSQLFLFQTLAATNGPAAECVGTLLANVPTRAKTAGRLSWDRSVASRSGPPLYLLHATLRL